MKTISEILTLAFALSAAGWRARAQEPPKSPSVAEKSYALPAGEYHPSEMALVAGGRGILFLSDAAPPAGQKIMYLLDLTTGKLRELRRGLLGHIYADPASQFFALDIHRAAKSELVILDKNGGIHQKLAQNPPSSFYFAVWNPDGTTLVYEADSGDVALDTPGAFTTLGVLDLDSYQWRVFSIKPAGYSKRFVLYKDRPLLCVSLNQDDDPSREKYGVYTQEGASVKASDELLDTCRYDRRRYYASHQYELPSAFQIFDSATHRPLRQFPGVDSKTGEQIVEGPWNPVDDDLIVIERQVWKESQRVSRRAEIYSVSHDGVIVGFTTPLYQWTPDGKSLVVFRDAKFVFEPVQP